MTLYCQECGHEYRFAVELDWLICDSCGADFRQLPGQSLDEFMAWLMFPPDHAAA